MPDFSCRQSDEKLMHPFSLSYFKFYLEVDIMIVIERFISVSVG
jgi:hypothetical protein